MPTPAFEQHVQDLTDQAAAIGTAAAAPGVARRVWQVPSAYTGGTDVQDPVGFVAACDRSGLNADCVDVYQAGGRLGLVAAYKAAIDYQAAWERALHARHASGVRCRVWAGLRRGGHGDPLYGVFGAVKKQIEAFVTSATAVDAAPLGEAALAAVAPG